MLKDKRGGTGLEFKAFDGADGRSYLVFKSLEGSFHAFAEVEAKQAARECGADGKLGRQHTDIVGGSLEPIDLNLVGSGLNQTASAILEKETHPS